MKGWRKNEGVDIIERMSGYEKDHCWQYDIRLNNTLEDIKESGLGIDEIKNLRVSDFDFKIVNDKIEREVLASFIRKHEWLGNLSQYTTHWFGAYYKGILSGVILMNLPNSFSKILGDKTKDIERLVSRGACISWSPKNLASNFLMWCIRYMVKTTPYRVFTAYSDPTAKELGTIYQACNWYYLGKKSGTTKRYYNPYTGKLISDRAFRQRSFYKRYATELGIEWRKDWTSKTGMLWKNIPEDIEKKLREMSKEKQSTSKFVIFPNKHKYVYILGSNKKETKELRKEFESKYKNYFDYPKTRGE